MFSFKTLPREEEVPSPPQKAAPPGPVLTPVVPSLKKSLFSELDEAMVRGMAGMNRGLPHGFPRLTRYVPNIQKGTYYLVCAAAKAGKTSLTDQMFLNHPYQHIRTAALNGEQVAETMEVDYWSLEISRLNKIAKAASAKLWRDTGMVLSPSAILSKGEQRLTMEQYSAVRKYRDYFEAMEDVLSIHDTPENPTGVYKHLVKSYTSGQKKKVGENLYESSNERGSILWEGYKDAEGRDRFLVRRFTSSRPAHHHIVVIDHVLLLEKERGFNDKETIDKMSSFMVMLRNLFDITPVVVQQLNYEIASPERVRLGRVEPMLSDLGDSKTTSRDVNLCLALFSPFAMNIPRFPSGDGGYDITRMKDSFRSLSILANRDGPSGLRLGLRFTGETGCFDELPLAAQMDYSAYK